MGEDYVEELIYVPEPAEEYFELAAVTQERRRVLIVDDHIFDILPIKTMLESMNVEVHTSLDPVDAVRRLDVYFYDLLILDWQMPLHNGAWVLLKAQDQFELAHSCSLNAITPFVIFSGRETVEKILPETENFLFLDHWQKPMTPQGLMGRLKYLIE